MSNCEGRTCPRSLRGGLRWIRTRNPPAARHRTYPIHHRAEHTPTPPRPIYAALSMASCTRKRTHAHTHTHAGTYAHTYTHTYTHTRTRTHTCTHIYIY